MPDCNGLVMGEIYISLEVEEAEDFGLGGELRAEVLRVNLVSFLTCVHVLVAFHERK